jgi:vanillin dehydrogenase
MARIPAGTRTDAARAVDAAAAAFPAWAELPPAEKQALFLRAADIVERRCSDIVDLLAAETGCAAGFAGFQVLTATRLLRQAANWGYLPVGEVIRSDVPGTFAMALRRPLGVVAGISPWNGAHVLAWRTVVNPLAFGNTVVLKPSEESPVSAGLLLPEIMEETWTTRWRRPRSPRSSIRGRSACPRGRCWSSGRSTSRSWTASSSGPPRSRSATRRPTAR